MRHAALCATILVICAVPLLVSLGKAGPQTHMEGLSLMTSQETWLRQASGEERDAWLLPTQNGQIRVRKPPMRVWLDMLAWTGLDPVTAATEQIIFRARLVSVVCALVMMLATWWIAKGIEVMQGEGIQGSRDRGIKATADRRCSLAAIAVMMCGSMLLVQQQARIASYDMPLAAFCTLSVAAALHGRWWSWILAAIALAAAWMTKGPIALLLFAIPSGCAVFVTARGKRLRFGLTAAGCITAAMALVSPWYIYLQVERPKAFATLVHEFSAELTNAQPLHFYPVQLFKLALPWTIWVCAGLALPILLRREPERDLRHEVVTWRDRLRGGMRNWGMRRSEARQAEDHKKQPAIDWERQASTRRAAAFASLWFVLLLIAFSIPAGKGSRYILPIVPAMALATALAFREHALAIAEKRRDPGGQFLMSLQDWAIRVTTLVFPVFLWCQPRLLDQGWLDDIVVQPPSFGFMLWFMSALIIVALLMIWRQRRGRFEEVMMLMVVWTSVFATVFWHQDAHTPREADEIERQAAIVADAIDDSPLMYLRHGEADHPDYEFLFFLRRIVSAVKPKDLGETLEHEERAFIMAEASDTNDVSMREAGFEEVLNFEDGPRHQRRLWKAP